MLTPTEWLPPFEVHQFFSTAECRQVRDLALQSGMQTATRIQEDGSLEVDRKYRSCDYLSVTPGHPVYELIAERIYSRLSQINRRYSFDLWPDKHKVIPSININRYRAEDNGQIGSHTDLGHFIGTDDRKLSVTVLLSDPDEYEGGTFVIQDGNLHTPLQDKRAGNLCVFPSFALHGVRPVRSGDRWSAVIWLRGPRFR